MTDRAVGVLRATFPKRKAEIEALKTTSAWRELELLGTVWEQGWMGTARWGVEINVGDRILVVTNAYEGKLHTGVHVDHELIKDPPLSRPISAEGLTRLIADLRETIVRYVPTASFPPRRGRPRKGAVPLSSTERVKEMRRRHSEERGWMVIQIKVHPDDAAELRAYAKKLEGKRRAASTGIPRRAPVAVRRDRRRG
jgi:hypothetical protein